MNRRTVLKRMGTATAGASALAAGAVSADGSKPGQEITVDGERYLAFTDGEIDPADVESSDVCDCDYCDPNLCSYCGPCP